MMSEKRFTFVCDDENCRFKDNGKTIDCVEVVDLLNEQQDQISYWKHKVNSLLWILGQFDEGKVKKLLKELNNE